MATTRLFCWLPEEEYRFLDYLEGTGTVYGVKDEKVTETSLLNPKPLRQALADWNPKSILLGQEQHLANLRITTTTFDGKSKDLSVGSRFYHIWAGHNNVLYYNRGTYREGKLVLSHLGVEWSYYEPSEGKHVKKTADFVKWGKKVFSWLSRQTLFWDDKHTFRCSERALKAIREGLETLPY